jgi:hypothetical protein
MVIPFRRTIWSATTPTAGTVGSDQVFIWLWSGPNVDIGAFQLTMWAMDDQYNGTVKRTAAAQVSEDGVSWSAVTLDPAPNATTGFGVNAGGHLRYTLTDGQGRPWLRIGLLVERSTTPAGSTLQTVEGRLTLVPETL